MERREREERERKTEKEIEEKRYGADIARCAIDG